MGMQDGSNPGKRTRRQENAAATQRALLDVANDLFARQGYLKTSLDEVAEQARVTKGALYHHFHNKEELFAACYERQVREMTRAVADADTAPGDPWQTMRNRCTAFLRFARQRGRPSIALPEAMTVLGWRRWRAIDSRYSLAEIHRTVQELTDAGEIRPAAPLLASQLIYSLLIEAAISTAHRLDRQRAESEVLDTLERMVRGLAQ